MNSNIERVVIYLTIMLISIGCGCKKIEYPSPSKKAINGSFVFNSATFQLGKKEYQAEYGTITVPENRSNKFSRLIHLPVIRIKAHNKNPYEPIFGFAGGPGQTNMNWTPIDSLLFDHDFVMVGYRGVDGSTVLNCPEVVEALTSGGDDLLYKGSLKKIGNAWAASAKRFKNSEIDLNGYTILETIEDMEAVRNTFHYDQINLISESYGTRVAYLYGLIHPEKINRSVMIGVNPPGGFLWDPGRTDVMINYYSHLWSQDSEMSKISGDLAITMKKVLNNMPRKWLFFSIDPGKVRATTFALLFHRKTAAMVFDSFIAAEKGDFSGLAMMSLAFDYTFPKMFVFGDLAAKAVSADFDYLQTINTGDTEQSRILGSPLNELIWKPLNQGGFKIKMIPAELRFPKKSDTETLMLSGSVDFTNPPECAKEFLPYLKNGKQIIFSEYGHVGDLRSLRKFSTDMIITNYFNKGIVDTSKIEYVPMAFKVKWGFPLIAKAALGVIIFFVIALTVGIVWIVKKINRKKMKASLMINEST